MNYKAYVTLFLIGIAAGIGIDHKLRPNVTNTVTQYQDKIVTETKTIREKGKVVVIEKKIENKAGTAATPALGASGRIYNWSVGPTIDTNANWGLITGHRMTDDLWVEFGIYQDKRISIGLRYEF